jgi:hypothetical protein
LSDDDEGSAKQLRKRDISSGRYGVSLNVLSEWSTAEDAV